MAFEEKLLELLVKRGMPENRARVVIDGVKAGIEDEVMGERWDHQVEGYPPQVLPALWMSVKDEALAYIDEACPEVWYRSMFVDEQES